MPLFLGKRAYLLREFQRLRKIVDRKDASQAFDSIELHDVPVSDVAMKLGDLHEIIPAIVAELRKNST
jgi:hypothetical protein